MDVARYAGSIRLSGLGGAELTTYRQENHELPLRVGTLIASRYRLGRAVVATASSMVHRAHDTVLRREVAVKFFLRKCGMTQPDPAAIEARALVGLAHVGVPTVYDLGEHQGLPYIVMHLLEGATLHEISERGIVKESTVAKVGMRIARVLAHAHARQYVHLNIEATNILVGPDDESYLVGFGRCRLHTTATPNYAGFADDVEALGRVLLCCLRGHAAQSTTSAAQLERALLMMMHADPARRLTAARAAAVLAAAVTSDRASPQSSS